MSKKKVMLQGLKNLGWVAAFTALFVGGVFGWIYSLAGLLSSEQDRRQVLKGSFLSSIVVAGWLVYMGSTRPDIAQDLWLVLAPGFGASIWLFLGPNWGNKTNAGIGLLIAIGTLAYMVTAV